MQAKTLPIVILTRKDSGGIQGYSGKGNVETATQFTHCLAHHSMGAGSACQEIKIFMRMLSMKHVYILLICMCSANSLYLALKATWLFNTFLNRTVKSVIPGPACLLSLTHNTVC